MKKKIAFGLLALLSAGLLAGAAEAKPCHYDKHRAAQWRNYRIAQAQRYRYVNYHWNHRHVGPSVHVHRVYYPQVRPWR
ncbi:MAG TPA: hypothetical protein V6C99_10060 [Oculatellaceae cyanobacterium]|jgi:hypothetical protein